MFFPGFGIPTPSPGRKSVRALRLPADYRPSRSLSLAVSVRARRGQSHLIGPGPVSRVAQRQQYYQGAKTSCDECPTYFCGFDAGFQRVVPFRSRRAVPFRQALAGSDSQQCDLCGRPPQRSQFGPSSRYRTFNAHALGRAAKPGVQVRNKVTNDKSYLLGHSSLLS